MKFTISSSVRRRLMLLGALLVADVIFYSMVDPTGNHVSVVIVGCALAVVNIYACWTLIVTLLHLLRPLSRGAQRGLCWAGSAVCSYLLLMQSIGQLDWRDAIAAILLAVILYLYIAYPSSRASA